MNLYDRIIIIFLFVMFITINVLFLFYIQEEKIMCVSEPIQYGLQKLNEQYDSDMSYARIVLFNNNGGTLLLEEHHREEKKD